MRVLIVNAGSSSLKLSVLDDERLLDSQELQATDATIGSDQIAAAVTALGPVDAVGHRIVHGGSRYLQAVKLDEQVLANLWELADLAPLHQAKSLSALEAVNKLLPDHPAVACFDTAFHSTIADAAATYALPRQWREQWGLRRFGFHGLSHAYASRRVAELLGRSADGLRIVTCHLGSGASLAAVHSGRSVDTTMGFTPLEGLVMATRSGSVDPGLLLWLLEHTGLGEREMADALEHEAGMLALAGTADMRAIIERADGGDRDARLAFDVYQHRLCGAVAAMTAALGGLDVIVWTGGVGEHAPAVRAAAADALSFLGIEIDDTRNRAASGDCELTAAGARVQAFVIAAREDLEIARQVQHVLAPSSSK